MKNSSKRPQMKIPKTREERIWNAIGYTIFLGTIIFVIWVWKYIPNEVPAHFNSAGEITRWGSKWELLIILIPGIFTATFMGVMERYPESHNYPKRFNEANAKAFYLHSRKMMNQLKNICLIIFSIITLESIFIAMSWWEGLGVWMLPLLITFAFFPLILSFMKRRKIK
ncbi:DUF1648 domain-containing protein [Virgibacillus dokdonensis]|uniref:DUF1648 domain-containing protein n=1 Tax=Virgibacillus dokdonensis TaxID=302167 RepID=A0ABU7VGJ9_9BACI